MPATDIAVRVMQRLAGGGLVTRFGTQIAVDAVAWIVGVYFGNLFRFDFHIERIGWGVLALVAAAAIVVQVAAGFLLFLYRGRHPYGSFAEVRAVVFAVAIVLVVVGVPTMLLGRSSGIPRSTIFIAAPLALICMLAVRYLKRLLVENSHRSSRRSKRALIYGAGTLGASLVRRMLMEPGSTYDPVGLIDDSPSRRNAWFEGVRVLGTGADLARIALATQADIVVVAVARADAEFLRGISDAVTELDVTVQVLPPLDDVLGGASRLRDLRDVSIEDLVGRHPVDTEISSIAGYLRGKRILVTGAGGSIGSELCRQIARFDPTEIIMLDRDESGLQEAQIRVRGHGLLDTDDVVLADIRDQGALNSIFAARRPEVVFHAAALKHLPMLEQYPDEAWKTNVLGTLNVLESSREAGVETFVNISTDKAASPTSMLGHSKRVAEKLTAWFAEQTGERYLSVRFGNVLGSRGSMIPTFSALIESGGPLTITHPDVTRYFMTIPEACQLVVQAGGIGDHGEVLILDMGEPVRIVDIARRMIEMSGKNIEIVYTGLRQGEKLHEELTGEDESGERRVHPLISHTTVDPTSPDLLDQQSWLKRTLRGTSGGTTSKKEP